MTQHCERKNYIVKILNHSKSANTQTKPHGCLMVIYCNILAILAIDLKGGPLAQQGVSHCSTMITMTEVFPSFLELFAYAERVTSGPGRILSFISGLSLRWIDDRNQRKFSISLSFFAILHRLLSSHFRY